VIRTALALPVVALACLESAAGETILITEGSGGHDTAVYAFIPSLVRGDYPTLYAFSASEDGQDHSFRSFLRFDVAQEIEPGACIEEAELSLYYAVDVPSEFGTVPDEPGDFDCRPVLQSWNEMGTTWSSQPSVGSVVGSASGIDAYGYYGCDVTSIVQDWSAGRLANNGIAVSSNGERGIGFYSFEANVNAALKAALIVTFADDPRACPEPAAPVAAALAALGAVAARRRR
jgi:MYXO-CTERM domain-containing protein